MQLISFAVRNVSDTLGVCLKTSPSSRGLGHRPFTAVTRVRTPLGALGKKDWEEVILAIFLIRKHVEERLLPRKWG